MRFGLGYPGAAKSETIFRCRPRYGWLGRNRVGIYAAIKSVDSKKAPLRWMMLIMCSGSFFVTAYNEHKVTNSS